MTKDTTRKRQPRLKGTLAFWVLKNTVRDINTKTTLGNLAGIPRHEMLMIQRSATALREQIDLAMKGTKENAR